MIEIGRTSPMCCPAVHTRYGSWLVVFFSLLPFVATSGCAAEYTLRRDTAASAESAPSVRWFRPVAPRDRPVLLRWRTSVGPPVVCPAIREWTAPADELTIVSWNTALGAGDVPRFVATLPHGPPIVLLLQEVYRGGIEVPSILSPGSAFARRQGGAAAGVRYEQIEPVAAQLGLSLFYVPSMRNGSPAASAEDRGNAILSSLPLTDLAAVELPFERQRRVAVAATIAGVTSGGTPWQLRLVNAHLDNTFNPTRLWVASEYGRTRQARGLLSSLDEDEPLILGGDFNTWFGFADQAFETLARRFPSARVADRRPTFLGLLRLDHLFFRLPPGWTSHFRRAEQRFGSDHFPLVGTVRVD
jgi:endonuclease/exonuclease/phosphatase family metal-dependent hydrolase